MKLLEIIIIVLVVAAILFAWTHYETLTGILLPIFENISDGLTVAS